MNSPVDKRRLLEAVCARLQQDLDGLKAAAAASYEAAVGEESKPENEYDTRGLEASYIAQAQAKRAGEIAEQLAACRKLELRDFAPDEPIDATALVELDRDGKRSTVFLLPKGGGISVDVEPGRSAQIIGPSSPLGEALIGLREGDEAVVESGRGGMQAYEVLSVR